MPRGDSADRIQSRWRHGRRDRLGIRSLDLGHGHGASAGKAHRFTPIRRTTPLLDRAANACSSRGKTAQRRIYEVATAQPTGPTLTVRQDLIPSFSPDGRLACLADGPEARLWDVARRRPAGPPLSRRTKIIAAPFTPNGTALRTLARQFTAQEWDIRPDSRPAAEILQWANCTRAALGYFGGLVPLAPNEQIAAFQEWKAKSPGEFGCHRPSARLWRIHEAMMCRDGDLRSRL